MDNEPEMTNEGPVEYEIDLNDLPGVTHKWIDRGDVVSCEGAGHASHRHFKVRVQENTD